MAIEARTNPFPTGIPEVVNHEPAAIPGQLTSIQISDRCERRFPDLSDCCLSISRKLRPRSGDGDAYGLNSDSVDMDLIRYPLNGNSAKAGFVKT